MASFTLRKGARYRATVSLGLMERLASNDMIAAKLQEAGFDDVSVAGSGTLRVVEASWAKPDATEEMPSQVTEVVEI